MHKYTCQIDSKDALDAFLKLYKSSEKNFLFESKDVSQIYGRLSVIGIDPVLEIKGKNENFSIENFNNRSTDFALNEKDLSTCDEFKISKNKTVGSIKNSDEKIEEGERTKKKNISQIVRIFLEKFKMEKKELIGLYGAFSYDFIRLFEKLPEITKDEGIYDFRLCLFDTFVFFDHLKEETNVVVYRKSKREAKETAEKLAEKIKENSKVYLEFKIENAKFDLEKEEYESLVNDAKKLAREGELFEIVYSNTLRADFKGDPLALYKIYRETNPSPYLYYFNFGDEQLVGASPEMMVRYENNLVHLRPISGTALRGKDPIEDHENMLNLLKSEKERAELDMLIDLGRNDLTRVCEPNIRISDYRFVEKYSRVMHTVAHLTGNLRKEFTALDALIACLNAGTLTGAPKVAAMIEIEKKEKSRRGYYGGTIGYLALSGNMDTGIIIRTAHIKNGRLTFRVGATLLYDSEPVNEYQETLNKAQAFLNTFTHV